MYKALSLSLLTAYAIAAGTTGSYFDHVATVKPHKHFGNSAPSAAVNSEVDVETCVTDTDCDFRCCTYA